MKLPKLLEPKRVSDLSGRQVYTSGRLSPFHRGHYMMMEWALIEKHAKNLTVFLVEEPKPLDASCPFTNKQRTEMIKNCFSEVDVYTIPPLTSFKKGKATSERIYGTLDKNSVYMGGGFQHIFAAKIGGSAIADYERGMFDEKLGGSISATRVRTLMYENNDSWKDLIPEQNHNLLEELIQTTKFRDAMQQEPPAGNPIRRIMKQLNWVH